MASTSSLLIRGEGQTRDGWRADREMPGARKDGAAAPAPAPGPSGGAPVPKAARTASAACGQGQDGLRKRKQPPRPSGKAPVARPANENEPSNAALMGRLKRKPVGSGPSGSRPLSARSCGSLSLSFLMWWAARNFNLLESAAAGTSSWPLPLLSASCCRVILMFAVASIFRRSQQMSHVSEALVQTALRLMRPEDVTTDGLKTVGQAVRREVSQLVGGVEHAVNRAGELETARP